MTTITNTYDGLGNRTEAATTINGVSQDPLYYTYNADSEVTSERETDRVDGLTQTYVEADLTYNADGQIATVTRMTGDGSDVGGYSQFLATTTPAG